MKQTIFTKYYLLLIPFVITLISCSKTNYAGSYTKNLGNNYYGYLILKQDYTFEYKSNEYSNTTQPYMPVIAGPVDSVGVGRYKIRKKEIYLDYGTDITANVFVDTLNYNTFESNIDFCMMDQMDSLGLPFINISYSKPKGHLEGVNADVDGKASMKIDPNDFPLELNFRFLGYAPENVYLEKSGDYKISIYFHEAPKRLQGKRVYPITETNGILEINGYRRMSIFSKVKTKKK